MERRRAPIVLVIAAALGPSCARTEPPPVGEVLVIVDTDMPVPALVNRARIDVYAADGTWFATRDVELGRRDAWPFSFGVALRDEHESSRSVLVRIRGYPDGYVRDYRGERFADWPADRDPAKIDPVLPDTGQPELHDPAGAPTPSTEPEPLTAVDRLARVQVEPGKVRALKLVLHGACAGTMADLANAATCIDTEHRREPVGESVLDDSLATPASVAGTFAKEYDVPCSSTADDRVCVRGGPFIFGTLDNWTGSDVDDLPRRVAIVRSFTMDREEVTVGRFRAALARGFSGGTPYDNINALSPNPSTKNACTWSASPMGREDRPLNCVQQEVAALFCAFEGGDLPYEVEWEYAATASPGGKNRVPWGTDPPACDGVVFGRSTAAHVCSLEPLGIPPAGTGAGDATASGILDLAGSMSEHVLDHRVPLASHCWLGAPQLMPTCPAAGATITRGGCWGMTINQIGPWTRTPLAETAFSPLVGFRCVWRER